MEVSPRLPGLQSDSAQRRLMQATLPPASSMITGKENESRIAFTDFMLPNGVTSRRLDLEAMSKVDIIRRINLGNSRSVITSCFTGTPAVKPCQAAWHQNF